MKYENILAAASEARRFLKAVDQLVAECVTAELKRPTGTVYVNHHPKQSGSVRRASMDLTRSLAEMRRSDG